MSTQDVQYGHKTFQELQKIKQFGYSFSTIFNDFVNLCLATVLSYTDNLQRSSSCEEFNRKRRNNELDGEYEVRYHQLTARYKENATREPGQRPADYFRNAWLYLQAETYQSQKDVLGHIYESQISNGSNGQYWTPEGVAQILNRIAGAAGQSMLEPTCGSGALIIEAFQNNPKGQFRGIEISPTCARMAALNMWLFDIHADIYRGDMLHYTASHLWRIRPDRCIWEHEIK